MKGKMILKGALLALVPLFSAPVVSGAETRVKASLDSVRILMGRQAILRLEVVQPEGAKGAFPQLIASDGRPYYGVCGDSVELSRAVRLDTVPLGTGRVQVDWYVPVQAFDSGYYHLPSLPFVIGTDTTWSNSVGLQVIPVAAKAEDPIADYTPPSDAEGKSWTDMLPDWLYYYWWVILCALLLVGAMMWIVLKRRKGEPILPTKPAIVVPPVEEALARLARLKERKLWEKGMEKEYFTDLTEILRHYLYRRFGINAMEMTSRQILDTLASDKSVSDKKELVKRILDMADFVKFAQVRPLPSDNVAAFDNTVSFVEATRPETVEKEDSSDATNTTSCDTPGEDKRKR